MHTHTHTHLDPLFLVKHQHVGAVQQPSLPVGVGAQAAFFGLSDLIFSILHGIHSQLVDLMMWWWY